MRCLAGILFNTRKNDYACTMHMLMLLYKQAMNSKILNNLYRYVDSCIGYQYHAVFAELLAEN